MNVIEYHTWNATRPRFAKPDRMTFDLDPGEGVEWAAMQQAAELVRGFLKRLGLPAFLKTSGGKGLHVVTPVVPKYDWDTVKDFLAADRPADGRRAARAVRREERPEESSRAHLHRLPAQRIRGDDGLLRGQLVRGRVSASRCRSTGPSSTS